MSHSKRRTTRVFKPNLHSARIMVGTTTKKLKLCTKCLRMFKVVASANSAQAALANVKVAKEAISPEEVVAPAAF